MAHGPKTTTETTDEKSDNQATSLTRTLLEWIASTVLILPFLAFSLIGLAVPFPTATDFVLVLGLFALGGGALVVGLAGALDALYPADRKRGWRDADAFPLYGDRLPHHPDNPKTLPPDQIEPVRVLEPSEDDLEELL